MALWTPAEITTDLWLDATDSGTITLDGSNNVEQWDDKSGNSRHATQSSSGNRPNYDLVNSRVGFTSSSGTYLDIDSQPFVGTTPRTVFAVINIKTFPGSAGGAYFSACHSSSPDGGLWDLCPESGYYWIRIKGNDYFSPAISSTIDAMVVSQWESGSSNTSSVWHDGVALSRAGGTSRSIDTQTGTSRLGRCQGQTSQYFDGYLYEIVILTGVVSSERRQIMEGYLAHKWNLESNLPIDHPYKDEPPYIFTCGGYTAIDGTLTSGIKVRLYRRDDGSLVGETTSAGVSGTFSIDTYYDTDYYAIALLPTDSGTNSLIYDWLKPGE